ncbi:zinc dependent phospholipase C family protein [Ferrovibrio sp.]|uniref:zinc dependent phospholipase C family protein n=1 Tax=Ferrovibrio sp. TaxID=1917215 RepID=UPI000CBDEFE7|nr:zinc dependent phospholipase C family protein [Ferrovibrio sp.]PJI42190.1 MAG: hypothetical protein CTR53_07060 [Ferrovibrio sp.]
MPGAYAHMTLVNLAADENAIRQLGFREDVYEALGYYLRYAELGAVSPDYPYLAPWYPKAKDWADKMHYVSTDGVPRQVLQQIQGLSGNDRLKTIAWLLGYMSHVIGDVTIHPVVELKVGKYKGNEKDHRICEMHQDVYIFRRLKIGTPELADHLDNNGIRGCVDNTGALDGVITNAWKRALEAVYPESYGGNEPDPRVWHKGFGLIVDNIAEQTSFMALARHVLPGENDGLAYPKDVKSEFIDNLKTPEGVMSYDAIFDRAINNVRTAWSWLNAAIDGDQGQLQNLKPWDLDTGRDASGKLGMWA